MRVEVWSDVRCPWCLIGHRRLHTALESVPDSEAIEVVWRSFELNPDEPAGRGRTIWAAATGEWGFSEEGWSRRSAEIDRLAAAEDVPIAINEARAVNTLDAHRLLHLAASLGDAESLLDRLFRAHLADHLDVSDHRVLARVAADAGLPAADVARVLDSDEFTGEVRADERRSREVGVTAVPTFLAAGRTLTGAPTVEQLRDLLTDVIRQGTEVREAETA